MSAKIVIGEKEMTVDEARELWAELCTIFGNEKEAIQYVPYVPYSPPWQEPWTVYGENTGDIRLYSN